MELYHYTECGLDYIWLKNGVDRHSTPYGDGISIHNVPGLHQAIGRHIVLHNPKLNGDEIRFLRKEMDLAQSRLAQLFDVGETTVRNWESGRSEISGAADRLLRICYLGHIDEDSKIKGLVEYITDVDRASYHRRCELEEENNHWKTAA